MGYPARPYESNNCHNRHHFVVSPLLRGSQCVRMYSLDVACRENYPIPERRDIDMRLYSAALIAFWIAVPNANAAIITFQGNSSDGNQDSARTSFLAQAGSLSLEGFNTAFSTANSVNFPVGASREFRVTAPSGGFIISDTTGFLTSEGGRNLRLDLFSGDSGTWIFDSPITAFGIDINDVDRIFNGSPTVLNYADNAGNSVTSIASADVAPDTDFFFGLISDAAFSQLTITQVGVAGEALGFDRMYYGTASSSPEPSSSSPEPSPVPEPSSAALLVTVAFGCGVARLRRKSKDQGLTPVD